MHDYPMSETLRWLIACKTSFINGFGGNAADALEEYQRTTTELSGGLGFIFTFDDLQEMLLTRRHWLLMEMVAASNGPTIHELINAEATDRRRDASAHIHTTAAREVRRAFRCREPRDPRCYRGADH